MSYNKKAAPQQKTLNVMTFKVTIIYVLQLDSLSTKYDISLQGNFCSSYDFVGHGARNETFMEVAMDIFSHSLKSAHQAKILRIKLTQKATACLTLEVIQVSIIL